MSSTYEIMRSEPETNYTDEDDCLLGYWTVKTSRSWPMFQMCLLPPSSGLSLWWWRQYGPLNFGKFLRQYKAAHRPRRQSASSVLNGFISLRDHFNSNTPQYSFPLYLVLLSFHSVSISPLPILSLVPHLYLSLRIYFANLHEDFVWSIRALVLVTTARHKF
jgi:hypothetical protein